MSIHACEHHATPNVLNTQMAVLLPEFNPEYSLLLPTWNVSILNTSAFVRMYPTCPGLSGVIQATGDFVPFVPFKDCFTDVKVAQMTAMARNLQRELQTDFLPDADYQKAPREQLMPDKPIQANQFRQAYFGNISDGALYTVFLDATVSAEHALNLPTGPRFSRNYIMLCRRYGVIDRRLFAVNTDMAYHIGTVYYHEMSDAELHDMASRFF